MSPKLLILTQYYPPEMGAPQARLSELAVRLEERDWNVQVLTALPNYPKGQILPGYSPWRWAREVLDSIDVVRVPLFPSKKGFIRRLICYFSFVLSAALLGGRLCRRPDLIWIESPPLFLGLAARFLAWRWKCPYVMNVSDLWPESAVNMGMISAEGFPARWAEALELYLYRGSAAVTGQSKEIITSVEERSRVSVKVVTNGVDPSRFRELPRDPGIEAKLVGMRRPIFGYAGLFGYAQGLDQILELALSLPENSPGSFLLVGEGPEKERLEKRVEVENIQRVRILDPIPREEIPVLLTSLDGALISLGMAIRGAVPSKIYEAMAAAIPILLIAEGEAAHRVLEAGAGWVVPPGAPEKLRECFRQIVEAKEERRVRGASGRKAAENIYDRNRIADGLDHFLRGVIYGS